MPNPRHVKMGICPVCDDYIRSNQRTAYRLLAGVPVRIHHYHLEET